MIGGGDTGADCVGNALREGARSVVQLELLSEPAAAAPRRPHAVAAVAAEVPPQLRDGGGEHARASASRTTRSRPPLRRRRPRRRRRAADRPGRPRSRRSRRSPAPSGSCPRSWCCSRWASCTPSRSCSTQLGVEKDPRGNIRAVKPYTTSVEGVFAAGDARRGQSLIVWAINEGRQCARMVDRFLAETAPGGQAAARAAGDEGLAGHADADERARGPAPACRPGDRSRVGSMGILSEPAAVSRRASRRAAPAARASA